MRYIDGQRYTIKLDDVTLQRLTTLKEYGYDTPKMIRKWLDTMTEKQLKLHETRVER